MFRATADQFEKSMERGGFSEAFYQQALESKRRKALEFKRQSEIEFAKRYLHVYSAPPRLIEIVLQTADKHKVSSADIVGESRFRNVVTARHEAWYLVKAEWPCLSLARISKWFGRDHTSLLYGIAKHGLNNDVPKLTTSDAMRVARSALYRRTQEAGK